ncbi:hypothetical protein [Mesobacillus subterraneus]|uniref:hypothetical protein n=1 Tax=Mesobacillus subterraneus TaxID=285983 RepID=UPI001474305E|nr:hypothetical protein [Mesobacillus subterraneus]
MMLWVIVILLVLIMLDVVRLHKKVDRLTEFLNPQIPPTKEEIESMLNTESTSVEK